MTSLKQTTVPTDPRTYSEDQVYDLFFATLKPKHRDEYKQRPAQNGGTPARRGFEGLDGSELQMLTPEHWVSRSPQYGDIIASFWAQHVQAYDTARPAIVAAAVAVEVKRQVSPSPSPSSSQQPFLNRQLMASVSNTMPSPAAVRPGGSDSELPQLDTSSVAVKRPGYVPPHLRAAMPPPALRTNWRRDDTLSTPPPASIFLDAILDQLSPSASSTRSSSSEGSDGEEDRQAVFVPVGPLRRLRLGVYLPVIFGRTRQQLELLITTAIQREGFGFNPVITWTGQDDCHCAIELDLPESTAASILEDDGVGANSSFCLHLVPGEHFPFIKYRLYRAPAPRRNAPSRVGSALSAPRLPSNLAMRRAAAAAAAAASASTEPEEGEEKPSQKSG